MGVPIYWPLNVFCVFVCVCLCVILNKSTSKKHIYQTSVNLTPCCKKHRARS